MVLFGHTACTTAAVYNDLDFYIYIYKAAILDALSWAWMFKRY